jgi:prophage maintenance system killer protein
VAKNHLFVDVNKRMAFLPIGLFLFLDGWRLWASHADAPSPCWPSPSATLANPRLRNACASTLHPADFRSLPLIAHHAA